MNKKTDEFLYINDIDLIDMYFKEKRELGKVNQEIINSLKIRNLFTDGEIIDKDLEKKYFKLREEYLKSLITHENLEDMSIEEQMKYFYHLCKTMNPNIYASLVSQDIYIEEKEFYMEILCFFMHREQKKIINRQRNNRQVMQ